MLAFALPAGVAARPQGQPTLLHASVSMAPRSARVARLRPACAFEAGSSSRSCGRIWAPADAAATPRFIVRCEASAAAGGAGKERPSCLSVKFDPKKDELLWMMDTLYNNVQLWETKDGSRVLFLDASMNLQSWYHPEATLTGGYYDALVAAAALGDAEKPVAVLGMGAGTLARALRAVYGDVAIHGWELDGSLAMIADSFFGLGEAMAAGRVKYHQGDATDAGLVARQAGGLQFGALLVDLFASGRLLPALEEVETWRGLRYLLPPGAVVAANLGDGTVPECKRALAAFEAAVGPALVRRPYGTTNCIALAVAGGTGAPKPAELAARLAERAPGLPAGDVADLAADWARPRNSHFSN
eukprot:tig00020610_g12011.t1